MEPEASCSRERNASEEKKAIRHLKRNDTSDAQKPFLDRHIVDAEDSTLACNGDKIEEGCLYEIDHKMLPPKSPNHLKAIRAVMVTQKTDLNVFVRFPSSLSLRKYFSAESINETGQSYAEEDVYPDLDEQLVMGANIAGKVLRELIPSTKFAKDKHLESFWLVTPNDEQPHREELLLGACRAALQCAGVVSWGVRRKVTFIGRHREKTLSPVGEEEVVRDDTDGKRSRKRPREESKIISKSIKKKKSSRYENERGSCSQDRWSKERYEAASKKLLEIMDEKGAVLGSPILRPALRAEARKHIGDTGLLDHLLKHMADKAVSEGGQRFRRRHNGEGAMEYWLEQADLIDLRKQAGVQDPYWNPPPGWKPGESPLHDHAQCKRELMQLKKDMADEVVQLKHDMADQLMQFKQNMKRSLSEKDEKKEAYATSRLKEDDAQIESNPCNYLQESYTRLLEKKREAEQQLLEISDLLNVMKEEMKRLSGVVEKRGSEQSTVVRSGFRMCKPQGTFLWPRAATMSSSQVHIQVEDLLVPTPPSVSSATSAPFYMLPPPQQLAIASPTKPLAEKRVPVSVLHGSASASTWEVVDKTADTCSATGSLSVSASYYSAQHELVTRVQSTLENEIAGTESAVTVAEATHQTSYAEATHQSSFLGTWLALATPCPQ